MISRPPRLRNRILACLILAWPHFAGAQIAATTKPAEATTTSNETLRQWIRDDNQLINGILTSLTHIDALVADIQRMVTALPDLGQTPKPVTPVVTAAPVAPIAVEKPSAAVETPNRFGWAPQIAGAGLLALLAFWLGRKRGMTETPAAPIFQEIAAAAPEPVVTQRRVVPPAVFPVDEKPSLPEVAVEEKAHAPGARPAPASPPPAATAPEPAPLSVPPASQAAVPSAPTAVDQSDQALELAEIMLSMGLGQGATQTLAEQIRNEPKQALRHWLKLLEIYRKNGQQEEFERSAEELRQHFNVKPEDWQAQPGSIKHSIEEFPHIARRLTELWGQPDCLVYMRNLLDDNRGGARAGFPQSVAEELLLLTAMLKAENVTPQAEEATLV